jgi:two-component system phosphate regulon sensor histidine kinase PhoR
MKKKRLYMILVLMSISLAGIIGVQWFWIRNAIEVREANYDRDIRTALASATERMEKRRNMIFMSDRLHDAEQLSHTGDSIHTRLDPRKIARFYRQEQKKVQDEAQMNQEKLQQKMDSLQMKHEDIQQQVEESIQKIRLPRLDSLQAMSIRSLKSLDTQKIRLEIGQSKEQMIVLDMNTFRKDLEEQTEKMQEVFREMALEYRLQFDSIRHQMDFVQLDTILSRELRKGGIHADYAFAVWNQKQDRMLYQSQQFDPSEQKESYRANLYPDDLIRKDTWLLLQIPRKQSLILQSLTYLLIGSFLFTLVIVITFGVTIHTILRQKKLSEIKTDFINNMTHEFKTPIATISLAADSIANPKILESKEGIMKFLKVIKSENKRMNNQVERVLQMSLLDKKDFQLDMKDSHIHLLLEQVVNNVRVQLERNGGQINYDPSAGNDLVQVDEQHFLNVMYNLMDNAIKYSGDSPGIKLSTAIQSSWLIISVEDRGVGIRQEELKRIFDRFYRVSTGNVHDVKGFGLGLSYVKAMVKEFGGDIRVSSQVGMGSRFELFLPVKTREHEEG